MDEAARQTAVNRADMTASSEQVFPFRRDESEFLLSSL